MMVQSLYSVDKLISSIIFFGFIQWIRIYSPGAVFLRRCNSALHHIKLSFCKIYIGFSTGYRLIWLIVIFTFSQGPGEWRVNSSIPWTKLFYPLILFGCIPMTAKNPINQPGTKYLEKIYLELLCVKCCMQSIQLVFYDFIFQPRQSQVTRRQLRERNILFETNSL